MFAMGDVPMDPSLLGKMRHDFGGPTPGENMIRLFRDKLTLANFAYNMDISAASQRAKSVRDTDFLPKAIRKSSLVVVRGTHSGQTQNLAQSHPTFRG